METWKYPIALTRLPLLALITGSDLPWSSDSGAAHVNDVGTTSLIPYVGLYQYAAYVVVVGI